MVGNWIIFDTNGFFIYNQHPKKCENSLEKFMDLLAKKKVIKKKGSQAYTIFIYLKNFSKKKKKK